MEVIQQKPVIVELSAPASAAVKPLAPALPIAPIRTRPWATVLVLAASDLIALVIASYVTVTVRHWLGGEFHPQLYWNLWPTLGLFVLVYAAVGLYSGVALYPGVALGPAEELRRAALATTWVYLTLGVTVFLTRGGLLYSRSIFLVAWFLSLFLIPFGREVVRLLCANRTWWGYPALVLGAGKTGQIVISAMRRNPGLGLKPVAVLDDDQSKWGYIRGVPVVGALELAPALTKKCKIPYVIIAMPGLSGHKLLELYNRYGDSFPNILLIPQLVGFSSLWVNAKDLGGVLGLEIRQQLLLPWVRYSKRCIDLLLIFLATPFLIPIFGLIALIIKLDSRGPVFYGQERVGHGGRKFKAWKFRTMYRNSQRRLQRHLSRNPQLRDEWEVKQKLKDDPRVTPVGRLLRRTSLDELPQLWNVIKGEMSLVGPRPIIDEEIRRYGERINLYVKVIPGITGLWQISGRSNTTYEERVNLDSYYVYNWSVWLDLYILARTILVVPFQKGAY